MRDYRISDPYQIRYILEYCEDIENELESIQYNKAVFDTHKVYQKAISFDLLQIGEHANNTSGEMKEKTKGDVMWHQIRGMRNRIAHGYKSVNLDIVWDIVTNEIPLLRQFCEKYLQEHPLPVPDENDEYGL